MVEDSVPAPQAKPVTEKKSVPVLMPDGKTRKAKIVLWANSGGFHVKLESGNLVVTEEDQTYFHALNRIREKIEPDGYRVLCYGASRCCWPSGMVVDADMVYRLVLGREAQMEHLVGTFDSGPDVIPATLAEQIAFRDQWFRTPKKGPSPPDQVPRPAGIISRAIGRLVRRRR